jgi:WD40 repeat protein
MFILHLINIQKKGIKFMNYNYPTRNVNSIVRAMMIIMFLIISCSSCQDSGIYSTPRTEISPTPTLTLKTTEDIPSPPAVTSTPSSISTNNVLNISAMNEWEVGPINHAPIEVDSVSDTVWAPNSKEYAIAAGDENFSGIEIFQIGDLKSYRFLEVLRYSLAFSPDGDILAASILGVLDFWEIETGDYLLEVRASECIPGSFLSFFPDGDIVVTGYDVGKGPFESIINYWDVESGECIGKYPDFDGILTSIATDRNGEYLIMTFMRMQEDPTRQVILWDVEDSECVCNIPGYKVSVGLDSDLMAVLDHDYRSIGIWDITTCSLVQSFHVDADVYSFDINPSGELLAVGGDHLQFWDVLNGIKMHEVASGTNVIREISFSPDGYFILTTQSSDPGQKNKVTLWGIEH